MKKIEFAILQHILRKTYFEETKKLALIVPTEKNVKVVSIVVDINNIFTKENADKYIKKFKELGLPF